MTQILTLLTQNIQEGISRERKGQASQVFESGSREDTYWLYVKQKGPKTGARFQSYCLHKTSHVYIIGRKHLVPCEDLLTVNINNGDLYKLHSVPLKHTNCNLIYLISSSLWNGLEKNSDRERGETDLFRCGQVVKIVAGMGKGRAFSFMQWRKLYRLALSVCDIKCCAPQSTSWN